MLKSQTRSGQNPFKNSGFIIQKQICGEVEGGTCGPVIGRKEPAAVAAVSLFKNQQLVMIRIVRLPILLDLIVHHESALHIRLLSLPFGNTIFIKAKLPIRTLLLDHH